MPRWRIRTRGQAAAIIVAACVSSLYSIGVAIAAASLLFAGPLSDGLALGAGAALIGTVIALGLTGAMSALPCNISHVQSMSAVVLAMTLSATAAQMQAPAETRVGTALAIIALTSVACSALLALTGALRAGRIGRFFPIEVLSGFVAGSGWLLLTGAMAMTTGQTPELGSWLGLANADRLSHFLPAVGFSVALYVAMRRFRHPMTLLVMLGIGISLFYAWLAVAGGSVADAAAANYLPRMEHGVAAQLAFPAMLGHVDWATVVESLPGMGSIAVLTLLATFLNISAIEHASGMTADADRELRVAGLVNAAGALAGAPPSNTGLAISMLAVKLGVRRRGAGMIAAATVLVALFFVEAIVAHVPRYVTGGLLLYFGINLLKEWLVDTRRRYSPREWWVVVAIVLMVAIQGFLTAIIAGFLIATVLFAWSYASVPVIRSQTSLDRLPSSHERGAADMELLSDFGSMVSVFRLQGFLFFGTVERLAEPVRQRRAKRPGTGTWPHPRLHRGDPHRHGFRHGAVTPGAGGDGARLPPALVRHGTRPGGPASKGRT